MLATYTPVPSLSSDEKRQVVYASLVRFAPEAGPLRERAVHRAVLGALVGSSDTQPFRVGAVKSNMMFGSEAVSMRNEVIQQALTELCGLGKVDKTLIRERHAYYLTTKGQEEIESLVVPVVDLFKEVNQKLFRDLDDGIGEEAAANIFRRFACECFGRFGKHIAQTVTGSLKREELLARPDARAAFVAASDGYSLTSDQFASLEIRCQRFLVSGEACDEKLKLYLTQGFYFTQLLGIDGNSFNPLAEDTFKGSVFYLDTNVLLLGFLHVHEDAHEFAEVVALAKRLGIELRVTRATVEEMQKVVKDRVAKISQIAGVIPDELVKRSNDQILQAFWHAFQENRSLTPEAFFSPFLVPDLSLSERWGVVVEEINNEEMILGRDTKEIGICMNEEAQACRGWGKGHGVLEHDVAHYLLVKDRRETNKKVWFLTRDRSLSVVAARLDPGKQAFCFPHLGLLHSISPFVTSDAEERSLAEIMSCFITDQIRPLQSLFDVSELAIMAEFHADVMATPGDQLVLAFDYVKSNTLKGQHYLVSDIPRVALELRKFLAADKDKQILALQAERENAVLEAQKENHLRRDAEQRIRDAIARNEELDEQVGVLTTKLADTDRQVDELQKASIKSTERQEALDLIRKRNAAIAYGFGAVVLLILLNQVAGVIADAIPWPWPDSLRSFVTSTLRVIAAVMIAIPTTRYIRETAWSENRKTVALVVVGGVSILVSKIITPSVLNGMADLIEVAALFAAVVIAVWFNRDDGEKKKG